MEKNNSSYVSISEELFKVRKIMGYSRAELAQKCNISEKTIYRAEKGEKIRYDYAEIIAKELGIDIRRLIINKGLTSAQSEIINEESRVIQAIAGPGSGKTTVMVKKVIKLLEEGLEPKNIVVFTFTEKAADELNHRIKTELKKSGISISGISDLYIGTIHGFCLHVLQDILNLYNDFSILTPVRTRIFVDKYFYDIGVDKIKKIQKNETMIRYIDTTKFLEIVSMVEENEVDLGLIPQEIKDAVNEYKSILKSNRYFDFTSILVTAYNELINNKQIKLYIKENIKYLLVDEYQDVNMLQENLIKIIYSIGAKILVVGDLDQSIYSWRGSDVKNFINFDKRYEDVKKMYLTDNFRSTKGIIDIANKCISNNEERINEVYINPVNNTYNPGEIVYQEFDEPEVEAEFIVDRIVELNKKLEVPLEEIAILLRKNKLANNIVNELERRNIPYIIQGVNKLFDTKEVIASVNIIKYLCKEINKNELEESWLEVYSEIKVSKVKEAIDYLSKIDISKSKLYNSCIIQNVFWESISIMDIIPLEGQETAEIEKICYNIGKFSQVIDDYESINFKVIPEKRFRDFCIFISKTAPDYYPEGYLENHHITVDGVRIMTIHQAKGLEFAAVFIPGMSNNLFPHQKMGGLSMWHYLPKKSVMGYERYTEKDIESERRLFYVAITRSKRFLIISRAKYSRNTAKISPFFVEVKKSYNIVNYDKKLYDTIPKWDSEIKNEPKLMSLSFSTLTDYKECPYKFKISNLYGFKQIIRPQNGYGKVMHNIVNDLNFEMLVSNNVSGIDLQELVEQRFFLPYLDSGKLFENLKSKCLKSSKEYYKDLKNDKDAIIEFVEQNIEVPISESIILKGRIDLVKKVDSETGAEKVFVVDFKTESEALKNALLANSAEEKKLSLIDDSRKMQLLIYAMGYKNLTGKIADFIQIHNLDNNNRDTEVIYQSDMEKLTDEIIYATNAIANNQIQKKCSKEKCSRCFISRLCTSKEEREKYDIEILEN